MSNETPDPEISTAEALTPEEIFDFARGAGFDPLEAKTATAIALAESNGVPDAWVNTNYGRTHGLWQIRHRGTIEWLKKKGVIATETDLFDPATNAKAAYYMAHHENEWATRVEKADWSDWETYTNPDEYYGINVRTDWNIGGTETAADAATRVFHQWSRDDSDVLTPEEVGGFGEPGSYASTTPADELREDLFRMNLVAPFANRVGRFMEDSEGAIQPLAGRMEPDEYKMIHQELTRSDPSLATEMGVLHETPFTRGNAALLHYPVDDRWAVDNASRYGLKLRPGFNNIVEPIGIRHRGRSTNFRDMSSDQIRNHLMEVLQGAVEYGGQPPSDEPMTAGSV
jgi:hypothetical protein